MWCRKWCFLQRNFDQLAFFSNRAAQNQSDITAKFKMITETGYKILIQRWNLFQKYKMLQGNLWCLCYDKNEQCFKIFVLELF